jgi:hypothetical protein
MMRVLGKFRVANGQREYCASLDAKERLWIFLSGTGGEKNEEAVLRVTVSPVMVRANRSNDVVVKEGDWTHLAVTWDASLKSDGVRCYVNGRPVATLAASSGSFEQLHAGTADLTLGTFDVEQVVEGGVTREVVRNPFHGRMADLRLYAGVLAAEEIADLARIPPAKRAAPVQDVSQKTASPRDDVAAKTERLDALRTGMREGMPASNRQEALARLDAIVTQTEVVALPESGLIAYAETIWFADGPKARSLIADWLRDASLRDRLSPRTLTRLLALAAKQHEAEDAEYPIEPAVVMLIEQRVQKEFGAGRCDYAMLRDLVKGLHAAVIEESARKWAIRAAELLLAGPGADDLAQLRDLARLLYENDLAGPNRGHAGLVQALIALDAAGRLDLDPGDAEVFGPVAGAADLRVRLAKALDTGGAPSVAIGKILGNASVASGTGDAWRATVAEREGRTTGDARVNWLLIRGYGETFAVTPGEPARRVHWYRKAQTEARSDAARFAVLREMALFYCERRYAADAVKSVEEVRPRLSGPPGQACEAFLERLRTIARDAGERNALLLQRVEETRQTALQAAHAVRAEGRE